MKRGSSRLKTAIIYYKIFKKKGMKMKKANTAIFTKVITFEREIIFVDREDIRLEYAREYREPAKYATFDGNGYSHETRIGYVLEARIYVQNFDFCWLSVTYGEGTGTIKGERVKICAHTQNLQDSLTRFETQKIGA